MVHERRRFPAPRLVAAAGLLLLALSATDGPDDTELRAEAATVPTPSAFPAPVATPNLPPRFEALIRPIGPETIARMGTSWRPGCPVGLGDLRSILMTHWSFAGAVQQGELIVHRKHAAGVAKVFEALFEAGFPIERMEPANGYMGNDPPLAQFNNTVGFNCRAPVGGGHKWSEHSYGTAVDINPNQNPYVSRTRRIEPPFGAPWADRTLEEPGMIHPNDVVVRAFRDIGWRWGGVWAGTVDYMHFSASGR
ncbi:MAG: M15 family metallopeptidase [Actinomycetota bacterium]